MSAKGSTLASYIVRRILHSIPLIFGVIILNFTLIHLAPGDPIYVIIGEGATSPEYMAMKRAEWGLDKPLYEQLFIYVVSILRGDLGESFIFKRPVLELILYYAPNTILLVVTSTTLAVSLGVFLGIAASKKPHSMRDYSAMLVSLIGYSMPLFWLGQLSLLFLGFYLRLFPVGGMLTFGKTGVHYVLDVAHHLVLPSLCLSFMHLALTARLMRVSMSNQLREDYIMTARAKGLSEDAIVRRHALKNAVAPVVTITGIRLGYLLFGGAIVTETVFSWPGLGRLMYNSVTALDYPVLMGMFIFISITVIVANLCVDIIYSLLDPRIRYQ